MTEEHLWHVLDAFIPASAVIVASIIGAKKLREIHILVNSRLSAALDKIEALEKKLSGSEM